MRKRLLIGSLIGLVLLGYLVLLARNAPPPLQFRGDRPPSSPTTTSAPRR